jgi:dihydroorotase
MIYLTNARSVDGKSVEMLIEDARIVAIGPVLDGKDAETVLDCKGYMLLPGLVDLHVHLRDPGFEYKEDIASGTRAAARGGYTSVCCMANTNPVNDSAAVTRYIVEKAAEQGVVRVYPYGAVTRGLNGKELAEMGDMQRAGIVAVSDDGKPVMNAAMMRTAMRYALAFDLPVASHAEDKDLTGDGAMHEGAMSTYLGIKGIPASAEESMTARDCILALETGARLHICHVSTRGAVNILRHFKKLGANITCETAPHYIAGTDALCEGYDAMARVSPPLRSEDDRNAVIEGLLDGTIDCIATDHAPHHRDDKEVEFALAATGISGLETALALCNTHLVKAGKMPIERLIGLMSANPARIFRLPGGALERGQVADFLLFDEDEEWTIDAKRFASKGKNTPFDGHSVQGRVKATFVGGQCVYSEVKA